MDTNRVNIKLYHIVHVDRLPAIVSTGYLLSDAGLNVRNPSETIIGMDKIKKRRLKTTLSSYPDLCVGECVPFYFSPRSVMLYIMHMKNHPEINYKGGQESIIHLVSDLQKVVLWADRNRKRWVFTDSNAGSLYFNDYSDMNELSKIDWQAVNATYWVDCRERKQAEFLIEDRLSWKLIASIGVYSQQYYNKVSDLILGNSHHHPMIKIRKHWYY